MYIPGNWNQGIPVTHVRLNIFPDGGVSRLRLFGENKIIHARTDNAQRFGFVLVMLTVLTYYLHAPRKRIQADDDAGLNVETKKEEIASSQAFTYTALVLVSIGMPPPSIYTQGNSGKPPDGVAQYCSKADAHHVRHRLDRRFVLFLFFRERPNRTKDVRDELAGNLWAVHGGGFII